MTESLFNAAWKEWCGLWPKGNRTAEAYYAVLNGRITDYDLKQICKRLPTETDTFPSTKLLLGLAGHQRQESPSCQDPDGEPGKPLHLCTDDELEIYYDYCDQHSQHWHHEASIAKTTTRKLICATMQRIAWIAGEATAVEYHKRKPKKIVA